MKKNQKPSVFRIDLTPTKTGDEFIGKKREITTLETPKKQTFTKFNEKEEISFDHLTPSRNNWNMNDEQLFNENAKFFLKEKLKKDFFGFDSTLSLKEMINSVKERFKGNSNCI